MIDYTVSIHIGASHARVWAVLRDVERWHEWTASISSIRKLSPGPLGTGSRVRIAQPRLRPNNWLIVAWDEAAHHFAWTMKSPGLRVLAGHSVSPDSRGGLVDLTLRYSGIFAPIVSLLGGAITKRYMRMEAEGLKARCEASAAAAHG